jgi:hypothetical protein
MKIRKGDKALEEEVEPEVEGAEEEVIDKKKFPLKAKRLNKNDYNINFIKENIKF